MIHLDVSKHPPHKLLDGAIALFTKVKGHSLHKRTSQQNDMNIMDQRIWIFSRILSCVTFNVSNTKDMKSIRVMTEDKVDLCPSQSCCLSLKTWCGDLCPSQSCCLSLKTWCGDLCPSQSCCLSLKTWCGDLCLSQSCCLSLKTWCGDLSLTVLLSVPKDLVWRPLSLTVLLSVPKDLVWGPLSLTVLLSVPKDLVWGPLSLTVLLSVPKDLVWGPLSLTVLLSVPKDLVWGPLSLTVLLSVPKDLVWGPLSLTVLLSVPKDLVWGPLSLTVLHMSLFLMDFKTLSFHSVEDEGWTSSKCLLVAAGACGVWRLFGRPLLGRVSSFRGTMQGRSVHPRICGEIWLLLPPPSWLVYLLQLTQNAAAAVTQPTNIRTESPHLPPQTEDTSVHTSDKNVISF